MPKKNRTALEKLRMRQTKPLQRWRARCIQREMEVESSDDYGPITIKRGLRVTIATRMDKAEPARRIYETEVHGVWFTVNPMKYPELRYPFEIIEKELQMLPRTHIGHQDTDGQRPHVIPDWQARDPGWKAFQAGQTHNPLAAH